MLASRTAKILAAVIQDFIATGEPVSSKKLVKKHDFRVKDATIRNELNELISEGFLYQPHTSSGRVPTDKGYRFFAEQLLDDFAGEFHKEAVQAMAVLSRELARREFEEFVDDAARELRVLGVGYMRREDEVYKSGLDELFAQFTDDYGFDQRAAYEIVKDFEMLDERMADFAASIKAARPQVFIGKSPLTKSGYLSVIADHYNIDGERFILAAVGPKRMDYGRNIRFFKTLRKAINA